MRHFLRAGLQPDQLAEAREAFNIEAEPTPSATNTAATPAGQRLLMARRLVAAGVRFVTLTYGGWDMHNGHHRKACGVRCPRSTRPSPR
jgi:hypothetical protein